MNHWEESPVAHNPRLGHKSLTSQLKIACLMVGLQPGSGRLPSEREGRAGHPIDWLISIKELHILLDCEVLVAASHRRNDLLSGWAVKYGLMYFTY